MPAQLALRFSDVPVDCEVQERYHAIAPKFGRALDKYSRKWLR